jgi:hypothetical protein
MTPFASAETIVSVASNVPEASYSSLLFLQDENIISNKKITVNNLKN